MLSDNKIEKIEQHVNLLKDKPGALLPLMHAIQDDIGYIPEESYEPIKGAQSFCCRGTWICHLLPSFQDKAIWKTYIADL